LDFEKIAVERGMPQLQLPVFPVGVTQITSELAFEKRDGQVFYFNTDFAEKLSVTWYNGHDTLVPST
jgi:hypothetical protein